MKRLSISILAVIFSIGAAFSQPVSELGIIPVGVTLNSILRLNITSGGNLEYVINTIDQYQDGISIGDPYTTNFNVASSVDFNVTLVADADDFTGVDNDATPNTMDLDNLGYTVVDNGGGNAPANWSFPAAMPLAVTGPTAGATTIITGTAGASAGGIDQNAFILRWEFGTGNGNTSTAGSLLTQSIAADRYVVNVFLELVGK